VRSPLQKAGRIGAWRPIILMLITHHGHYFSRVVPILRAFQRRLGCSIIVDGCLLATYAKDLFSHGQAMVKTEILTPFLAVRANLALIPDGRRLFLMCKHVCSLELLHKWRQSRIFLLISLVKELWFLNVQRSIHIQLIIYTN